MPGSAHPPAGGSPHPLPPPATPAAVSVRLGRAAPPPHIVDTATDSRGWTDTDRAAPGAVSTEPRFRWLSRHTDADRWRRPRGCAGWSASTGAGFGPACLCRLNHGFG